MGQIKHLCQGLTPGKHPINTSRDGHTSAGSSVFSSLWTTSLSQTPYLPNALGFFFLALCTLQYLPGLSRAGPAPL